MVNKDYSAKDIPVLEGLEAVRKNFDVVKLSKKIKRRGDVLVLSSELKIKLRILSSAFYEGGILSVFPDLHKSKAGALAPLRTGRDLRLFSERYNLQELSVRELISLVKRWNQDIQENPLLLISAEEHEMIIGTLMGDASVRYRGENSCMRFSHSIKQKDYCSFKKNILTNFNISEFRESQREHNHRNIHMIEFSTKTHAVFNFYRNLFYSNGKKVIIQKILNQITPRSLAFWICDDGSYCVKQNYIILCTNSFSLEEHELMKNFFVEKFGLNPSIGFRNDKYYYLRFNKNDSEKLCGIVRPFIPEFMSYKIGGIKNVCG